MRIISGELGGLTFDAPKGHRTHPMSEKMRGALFSTLGDIKGLVVLDAFAGSGALSFEAVSRGAKSVLTTEIDSNAQKILTKNSKQLKLGQQVKVVKANVSAWSDTNPNTIFDLVLCDPPYDNSSLMLLQKLVKHVAVNGLYVLSWPGKLTAPEFTDLSFVKVNNYGDGQLVFYRKIT